MTLHARYIFIILVVIRFNDMINHEITVTSYDKGSFHNRNAWVPVESASFFCFFFFVMGEGFL